MAPDAEGDLEEIALLNGGPMDGREHPVVSDANEICVVMTDGQQHCYLRSGNVQVLPGRRSAAVFDWTGRYYGSK